MALFAALEVEALFAAATATPHQTARHLLSDRVASRPLLHWKHGRAGDKAQRVFVFLPQVTGVIGREMGSYG